MPNIKVSETGFALWAYVLITSLLAALRLLADAQATLKKSTEEFKKSLKNSERRVQALETELAKESQEGTEPSQLRRLTEELEDEREQHQKDLSERDFTIDQTRKKYQGMNYHIIAAYT